MQRWVRIANVAVPLALLAAFAAQEGPRWLARHPEHNPWAPLTLDQRNGWATAGKLAALRTDPAACRAVFEASGVVPTALPPVGSGACRRADRMVLEAPGLALRPVRPDATCAVNVALLRWLRHEVQPTARSLLGSEVAGLDHFGTYSCRPIRGNDSGRWSEHATGNAIDISAFRLRDGRQISVLRDWPREGREAEFLRRVRDGACTSFGTVLSPDYNQAHADHLHLDQAEWRVCR